MKKRPEKNGRPRKHDGKIDWANLNPDYFQITKVDALTTIYCAIVYSKSFKRNIKIACEFTTSEKGKVIHKIYFSTDLEMEAEDIIKYYRSRFQIEFLYRDGKQHTGMEHSLARSTNKLYFHFNISFTSINTLQGFAIGFRCLKKKGSSFNGRRKNVVSQYVTNRTIY
jgi:hypothetical protein